MRGKIVEKAASENFVFKKMLVPVEQRYLFIFLFFFIVSVIIICAEKATVRQILLAAEELNMIDNGEFVFFSVEPYRR